MAEIVTFSLFSTNGRQHSEETDTQKRKCGIELFVNISTILLYLQKHFFLRFSMWSIRLRVSKHKPNEKGR